MMPQRFREWVSGIYTDDCLHYGSRGLHAFSGQREQNDCTVRLSRRMGHLHVPIAPREASNWGHGGGNLQFALKRSGLADFAQVQDQVPERTYGQEGVSYRSAMST